MDNNRKSKIIQFRKGITAEEATLKGWEEDTDKVELDMSDLSDIADGYNLIKQGMELISNATKVSLDSV